jgi:hypothetical protein
LPPALRPPVVGHHAPSPTRPPTPAPPNHQTMDLAELEDANLKFTMVRESGVTYSMGEARARRGGRRGAL